MPAQKPMAHWYTGPTEEQATAALRAKLSEVEAERDELHAEAMAHIELWGKALTERDAAKAEVARLSTPPDDAEVAGLVMKARDGLCTKPKGGPFGTGWSVDLSATVELLNAMADALTRLSHATAPDRKLVDDLARALDYARGGIACGAEEALARHASRRKE